MFDADLTSLAGPFDIQKGTEIAAGEYYYYDGNTSQPGQTPTSIYNSQAGTQFNAVPATLLNGRVVQPYFDERLSWDFNGFFNHGVIKTGISFRLINTSGGVGAEIHANTDFPEPPNPIRAMRST